MDFTFLEQKKIPTAAAFLVLLVLMGGLVAATQNVKSLKSLLSFASTPANISSVEVSNVTDTSFTVSYFTDLDSPGAAFYGSSSALSDGVAVDDRDLTSPNGKYRTHFIRVSGLKPSTKYYFKVGASGPDFGDPGNGSSPFQVETGPKLTTTSDVAPIYGKALTSSGSPAAGAIAIWSSPGAAKLATLVKSDGNFVFPLSLSRTQDLAGNFTLQKGVTQTVTLGDGQTQAAIKCAVGGNDRPFPDVTLGQTLDCSSALTPPTAPSATSSAHFPPPSGRPAASPSGNIEVNIAEGQSVPASQPNFSGTAGPNQLVKIVIHSETPYSGTVVAGPDGSWTWTPPSNLAPGPHTVTITIINTDGTTKTVTRDFTVASGQAILPVVSGTPSAQTTTTTSTSTISAAPPVTGAFESSLYLLTLGLGFLILSIVMIFKTA